jgi:hypothetical protein
MPSLGYPPPEEPRGSKTQNRAAEVRDEALLRLIVDMNRTWEGHLEIILSRMDRMISAIELLAEAAGRPASSPPTGTPDKQRRSHSGALESSPGHSFLSLLRENYIQVIFGLIVGLAALLFAFYLFARAR